jgi:hypothetical protein
MSARKLYHMLALIVENRGVPTLEGPVTWIGPEPSDRDRIRKLDPKRYLGPLAHLSAGYRYVILANEDATGHVLISMCDDPNIYKAAGRLHLEVQLFGCFTSGGEFGNPAVMFTAPGELIRTHGELHNARDTIAQALREIAEDLQYY